MLAVANILFVASLVLGGVVLPISHLPGPLAAIAGALAGRGAERRACGWRSAGSGDAAGSLALLAGWGVARVGLAIATFRWE